LMTTMRVVGECFFWYRLTRVFPDKFHRAVKRLCVCVCSDGLRVRIKFMGQYGRPNLALAGILVNFDARAIWCTGLLGLSV